MAEGPPQQRTESRAMNHPFTGYLETIPTIDGYETIEITHGFDSNRFGWFDQSGAFRSRNVQDARTPDVENTSVVYPSHMGHQHRSLDAIAGNPYDTGIGAA